MQHFQEDAHPYSQIIASAMRRPELWRVGAAIVSVAIITIVITPLFNVALGSALPSLAPYQQGPDGPRIGVTTGGLVALLFGFSFLLGGSLWIAYRLNDRIPTDLIGSLPDTISQFKIVLVWILGFTILSFGLPSDTQHDLIPGLAPGRWILWLPVALIALMIQVTAEELFFRGYLQSQLAAATGSYPLGLCASALLFGLAHYNGTVDGMGALFPMIWAIGFGLVAGDLSMRSGTLGPAIALHLVNNVSAIFLVAQKDMMSGMALYTQDIDPAVLFSEPRLLILQLMLLFISWLIARLALKR